MVIYILNTAGMTPPTTVSFQQMKSFFFGTNAVTGTYFTAILNPKKNKIMTDYILTKLFSIIIVKTYTYVINEEIFKIFKIKIPYLLLIMVKKRKESHCV
jgi:hypothetical protein